MKEEMAGLLPHGESMCLLESVEAWDEEGISCRTTTHRDRGNPLMFHGRLTISSGLEYAAQAMGIHVGLVGRRFRTKPRIGLIGAVRDVSVAVERLDDLNADLHVQAIRVAEGENSFMYRFMLASDNREIMTGRASIFLKDTPL